MERWEFKLETLNSVNRATEVINVWRVRQNK